MIERHQQHALLLAPVHVRDRRQQLADHRFLSALLVHLPRLPSAILARRRFFFCSSVTSGNLSFRELECVDDRRGDDDAREFLVVGGHHHPWRVWGRRVPDHVLVGRLVVVPVVALFQIARGELPVLFRHVQPLEKPRLLLFLRDVQEELADDVTVTGHVALETVDVFEPFFPDPLRDELWRQLRIPQNLRVDANDERLLVVRPVEDADPAPLWQHLRRAPHEVVIELLG